MFVPEGKSGFQVCHAFLHQARGEQSMVGCARRQVSVPNVREAG